MGEVFYQVLKMSLTASVFVLLALLLQGVLKLCVPRAPRFLHVLIWGMVAFRLLCPFSIQTDVSIVPYFVTQHSHLEEAVNGYVNETEVLVSGTTEFDAAVDAGRQPVYAGDDRYEITVQKGGYEIPMTVKEKYAPTAATVWLCGVIVMLVYAAGSYVLLRLRLASAEKIPLSGNVYRTGSIRSPVVAGVLFPRIYLPYRMTEAQRTYHLAYLQAHVQRKDTLLKCFAFLLLSLHWFNPFAWLAYLLLCRDLSFAADQRAIRDYSSREKEDFSCALLTLGTGNDPLSNQKEHLGSYPMAFGESMTQARAKAAEKHRHIPTGSMLVLCMVILGSFLFLFTDPYPVTDTVMGADYKLEQPVYRKLQSYDPTDEKTDAERIGFYRYRITADHHLYRCPYDQEVWEYVGRFYKDALTDQLLQSYLPEKVRVGKITDSYRLDLSKDSFYLVFRTQNGKTYLGYGAEDRELHGLYETESLFPKNAVGNDFFEASLDHLIGEKVRVVQTEQDKATPDHLIVCFQSGDRWQDMGYAVFAKSREGYRYLNHRLYKDAAIAGNRIYFCEHPAVCDDLGFAHSGNSYDMVLLNNKEVSSVRRVDAFTQKEDKEYSEYYPTIPGMVSLLQKKAHENTDYITYCHTNQGYMLGMAPSRPITAEEWINIAWEDEIKWSESRETTLEAFPGVSFVWTPKSLHVVEENGETDTICLGDPIDCVYFSDINGDGYPEVCMTYQTQGHQPIYYIRIYDYHNDHDSLQYTEYRFLLTVEDGILILEERSPSSKVILAKYYVTYTGLSVGFLKIQ